MQSTPLAVTNIFAYFREIVMSRTEGKYYGEVVGGWWLVAGD
jgi:hypothetical protein